MPHPTKGLAAWNKGKKGVQEAWNKGLKNEYHTGPRSVEFCQKLREANLGKHPTEETKQKIKAALTGRKHSEETKKKISEAKKRKS